MRALLPSILVASLVGVMLIPNAFAVDVVPDWIKNNAGWWTDGEIDDQTFVNGIQFLIKEEIIQVSDTASTSNNSEFIPEWEKNTAPPSSAPPAKEVTDMVWTWSAQP